MQRERFGQWDAARKMRDCLTRYVMDASSRIKSRIAKSVTEEEHQEAFDRAPGPRKLRMTASCWLNNDLGNELRTPLETESVREILDQLSHDILMFKREAKDVRSWANRVSALMELVSPGGELNHSMVFSTILQKEAKAISDGRLAGRWKCVKLDDLLPVLSDQRVQDMLQIILEEEIPKTDDLNALVAWWTKAQQYQCLKHLNPDHPDWDKLFSKSPVLEEFRQYITERILNPAMQSYYLQRLEERFEGQ